MAHEDLEQALLNIDTEEFIAAAQPIVLGAWAPEAVDREISFERKFPAFQEIVEILQDRGITSSLDATPGQLAYFKLGYRACLLTLQELIDPTE